MRFVVNSSLQARAALSPTVQSALEAIRGRIEGIPLAAACVASSVDDGQIYLRSPRTPHGVCVRPEGIDQARLAWIEDCVLNAIDLGEQGVPAIH